MLAVEVDVPLTVMVLLPITPRNIVEMLAEKLTVEVTVPFARATTGVKLFSVYPETPDILPLKILVASITPVGMGPSVLIEPAAMKAGEFRAIAPTLAESIAACNLLRSCVARE